MNLFPHFFWLRSYGLDVNLDRVEDVLLHQKLLALAKDPEKRPVYHIRFMEVLNEMTFSQRKKRRFHIAKA